MLGDYKNLKCILDKNEQIRKVQQAQIIHLKGNMRVFCRVKPQLYTHDDMTGDSILPFLDP